MIANKTGPVSIAQGIEQNIFFNIDDNKHISAFPQYLIKNKGKLYISVERTGRIYQVELTKSDSVNITRIDSTHFYGYNGDAILFSYNDTIFSFGGNGFWRNNGQLRYFSFKNHEWDILQIDQEIPTSMIMFYVDQENNCLYFTLMPYTDQSTGEKHDEYCFYKLDLKTKKNIKMGEIPKNLISLFTDVKTSYFSFVSIEKLNGVFVNFNRQNQFLFCFDKGDVYRIKKEEIKEIFYGSSERKSPMFLFSKNNSIFYSKLSDSSHSIDSFKVEMKDFVKEPYSLYEASITEDVKRYALPLSYIILISTGGLLYFKKKRNKISPIENPIIESEDESSLKFNAIENDLINKMIETSKAKKQFSVEDINNALGLGKKSLEIQKKGRTEAINRINHKFKVIFEVKEDLIERIRSEEDRRFYKYIISEEHARMVKK